MIRSLRWFRNRQLRIMKTKKNNNLKEAGVGRTTLWDSVRRLVENLKNTHLNGRLLVLRFPFGVAWVHISHMDHIFSLDYYGVNKSLTKTICLREFHIWRLWLMALGSIETLGRFLVKVIVPQAISGRPLNDSGGISWNKKRGTASKFEASLYSLPVPAIHWFS